MISEIILKNAGYYYRVGDPSNSGGNPTVCLLLLYVFCIHRLSGKGKKKQYIQKFYQRVTCFLL